MPTEAVGDELLGGPGEAWGEGGEEAPSGAGCEGVGVATEGAPPDGLHARLTQVLSGLTTAEVARRTGVHSESVRRYRRGAGPSARFLAAVCDAFGVSADWLLCGRGPGPSAAVGNGGSGQTASDPRCRS